MSSTTRFLVRSLLSPVSHSYVWFASRSLEPMHMPNNLLSPRCTSQRKNVSSAQPKAKDCESDRLQNPHFYGMAKR
ncbi:hypothetical protein BDP27DRAFT_1332502 [Rhodocollybia butyracea]|uniref:Uncharacterized protein n=1 Tax=Rhodocollybia butyracea TaxID=206335 RepID=A0A9P5PM84_9AGAR|nr:hypothetical protein BDP27DRAFT_1332502 [Rhodocollybia butyracea]